MNVNPLIGRQICRVQSEIWSRDIKLHFAVQTPQGQMAVAEPLVFRSVEPNTLLPEAVALSHDAAQQLMDELWQVGLRPSEGTGSAGALAATQKHLEDMQGIAIGLLRQQGVEL